MTTNVYDAKAQLITTDSRWSISLKDGAKNVIAVVYTDEPVFDKIEVRHGYSAMFAGDGLLIAQWKEWIASPNKIVLKRPPVIDDFALCLVENATGAIQFEHGQKIVGSDFRFAGTGARPAYKCWIQNGCAKRAVVSARADKFSGGEVKYVELQTGAHNLNQTALFESINKSILSQGSVMYMSENFIPIPIQEAAKKDARIEKLVTRIANGEVSAEAPSGMDPIVWTDSDVQRLDTALEKCFGPFAK